MDAKQNQKNVCIIGAGMSGLCSIKSCKEENFNVTCYEKSNDIGGVWNLGRRLGKDETVVFDSAVANTSKEMLAFSDFPPPDKWPNFLHNKYIINYLKMYAKNYDLMRHITFNKSVEKVKPNEDFGNTGKWDVHLDNKEKETFDYVMICTGMCAKPYLPDIAGIDNFKGSIVHEQLYANWEKYENQKVLVIGLANSGADIAVELARTCREVHVSCRKGCWVWSRMGVRGWPTDVRYVSRFANFLLNWLPKWLTNGYFEHLLNTRMDHSHYGLKPKHRVLSQLPIYSDLLPLYISNGHLILREAVKRFEEHSVVFLDDSILQCDVVIFCTGYDISTPLADYSINKCERENCDLYKNVFSPNLRHSSLAFIGFVEPIMGGVGPIAEMQSRWAAKVFTGELRLPSRIFMEQSIALNERYLARNFIKNRKRSKLVSYVNYMNDIANMIGCKPNGIKLFFTDLKLWYALHFGPCTAYTYRLCGPGSWQNARSTVLKTLQRLDAPLKTRKCEPAIWKPIDKVTDKYLRHIFLIILIINFYVMFSTDSAVTFWIHVVLYVFVWGGFALCTDLFFDLSTSF